MPGGPWRPASARKRVSRPESERRGRELARLCPPSRAFCRCSRSGWREMSHQCRLCCEGTWRRKLRAGIVWALPRPWHPRFFTACCLSRASVRPSVLGALGEKVPRVLAPVHRCSTWEARFGVKADVLLQEAREARECGGGWPGHVAVLVPSTRTSCSCREARAGSVSRRHLRGGWVGSTCAAVTLICSIPILSVSRHFLVRAPTLLGGCACPHACVSTRRLASACLPCAHAAVGAAWAGGGPLLFVIGPSRC